MRDSPLIHVWSRRISTRGPAYKESHAPGKRGRQGGLPSHLQMGAWTGAQSEQMLRNDLQWLRQQSDSWKKGGQ